MTDETNEESKSTNINHKGDNIQVGDISSAKGIAIGQGASAVSIENYHEARKEITFPIHHLPPANPNFTGRTDLLDAIQDAFDNQETNVAITQAITGLGGIGKTQLALAYAYVNLNKYDLIWWLNAESEPVLNESFVALGHAIGIPVDNMEHPDAIKAILTWITSSDKHWLLIYDNVDEVSPRALHSFLPGGQGHIIITSRNPQWGGTAQVLNVNVFTPDEAVSFLETRLGQGDDKIQLEYITLVAELGYLPLALEHAVAYIETRGKTAGKYLRLFQEKRQALLNRAQTPDAYHATITTTWKIAFVHAQQIPGAADLLSLCCFLAPEHIPLNIIQEHTYMLPETLATVVADELALDDALTALTRYSLMTKQDDQLAIHRLVQAVARDQIGEEREREWLRIAVGIMKQAFPFQQNDLSTWLPSSELLPHVITITGIAYEQKLVNNDIAFLCNHLGLFFYSKGEYKNSFKQMELALTIREELLGASHPDTAQSLNNLGEILREMGKYGEARQYYERALTIREEVLGPSHLDTALSLNNLGGLLRVMGQYGEALSCYERALTIREEVLGASHPDTARSLNSLGALLYIMGKYGEARPYYERALAIREEVLGASHRSIATSLNNLGALLYSMGRYSEAWPYYERALTIREEVLGPRHAHTAQSLNNLGLLLDEMGKYGEARQYYEKALAIREEVLGSSHPDTAQSLNNLGGLLRVMGQYREARQYYERALAIREEALGVSHPDTAQSLNNLGGLLRVMGQYREARQYYERALVIREEALGPDHPYTAESLNNLAAVCYYKGDNVEAARLIKQALAIREASLGPEHPDTKNSREWLTLIESELDK